MRRFGGDGPCRLAYSRGMFADAMTVETPRPEPEAGRRYAHGELLLAAFIAARRPLTFDHLASVIVDTGARISDLVLWMASSHANGLIRDDGYERGAHGEPVGPRRFSLSLEARDELRARRTRRRPR